nr:hypothetical protein [Tanacetum cinerariifolium]
MLYRFGYIPNLSEVHGNHFPASVNEEDNVNAGTVNKDANTVDDVGKDNDGLNSSPTKVTHVNSAMNKEGNLHDENDEVTPSKSTANPNKGTSYANLFTRRPKRKAMNFRTLFTPAGNEDDVVVSTEYVRVICERFANTIYCFFLGKRVAYTIVANYVKLYGVPVTAFSEDGLSAIATKLGTPLMLNSYTYDICIQSWGKLCYVRALIEDECPKNIVSDVVKNIKSLDKLLEVFWGNKKKDVEPKIEVSNSNPFDVLNSVENDVDFGTNGGTSNLAKKKTNSSGSSFLNVESSSTSTTHIIEKIGKIERLIIDMKVTFVDDGGKPLTKVYSSGDHDSED